MPTYTDLLEDAYTLGAGAARAEAETGTHPPAVTGGAESVAVGTNSETRARAPEVTAIRNVTVLAPCPGAATGTQRPSARAGATILVGVTPGAETRAHPPEEIIVGGGFLLIDADRWGHFEITAEG